MSSPISRVKRLRRWAPITGIAVERVRFDIQLLENPEISSVECLVDSEIWEYLLEKFGRHCACCCTVDVPLDHVIPRERGGSNRVSNLVLACVPCYTAKAAPTIEEFLAHDPGIPKTHAHDAACVGEVEVLSVCQIATGPIEPEHFDPFLAQLTAAIKEHLPPMLPPRRPPRAATHGAELLGWTLSLHRGATPAIAPAGMRRRPRTSPPGVDITTAIGACVHSADSARIAAYRRASVQGSMSAVGVLAGYRN